MAIGKIIKAIGGFYYIKTESNEVIETRAKGNFRHLEITPLVGDNVSFIEGKGDTLGYIDKIFPRKNQLLRPPVANVDQVVVLIPVSDPKYNLLITDKMLIHYELEHVPIQIVINKADLKKEEADYLYKKYKLTGYPVIQLSLEEEGAKELLLPILSGRTTALAGVSGSGKSTLTDLFIDENIVVGEISKKTKRGKHTTRHSELFQGKHNIFLLDTPGFSSMDISSIPSTAFKEYYPEFQKAIGQCKFLDCLHINEPGCKVKELVQEKIIWDKRYESYKSMVEESKEKESF